MIEFNVPGMTCNHCVASVKEAVGEVGAGLPVTVDLASKRVTVEAPDNLRAPLAHALTEAGYPPA